MDWASENYVRIYLRDTTTWKRLKWDGQNVLMQVLRKMDMAGVLDIEDLEPWEAASLHCGAPEDDAKVGMDACLRLGVLQHRGNHLVAPNFYEAQTTSKSDKLRSKMAREKRRLEALGVIDTNGVVTVTDCDAESHNGSDSHAGSQPVTPRHAASPYALLDTTLLDTAGRDDSDQGATAEPTLTWMTVIRIFADTGGIEPAVVNHNLRWIKEAAQHVWEACKHDPDTVRAACEANWEAGEKGSSTPTVERLSKNLAKYLGVGAAADNRPEREDWNG